MRVPISHYAYFWLVNSFMATGTGFVLGFMALRLGGAFILSPVSFPVGFLIVYQFIVASYFWGRRRGEFEYSFLEKSAMRGKQNNELGLRLKEVKQELKLGDPSSAHAKLKAVVHDFSENFVACFKYAISFEKMGLSENAISAYKKAEGLIPVSSQALANYVAKQVNRVKQKGPSKRSSAPGLQYVIY